MTLALLVDVVRLMRSSLRSRANLAAENLFLRKQLACYVERQIRPKRPDHTTHVTLALLSRVVSWREFLTLVRPETLVRWHRELSLAVLRIRARAPQANAYCERFIGTARRECFDWIIPLNERRLRHVLTEGIAHYNAERPHSARAPGLPDDAGRRADAI